MYLFKYIKKYSVFYTQYFMDIQTYTTKIYSAAFLSPSLDKEEGIDRKPEGVKSFIYLLGKT